jgi:hypothetical protein
LSGEDYAQGESRSVFPDPAHTMRAALLATMAQAHATLASAAVFADGLQDPDGEEAVYARRAWRLVTELDVEESGDALAAEGRRRLEEESRYRPERRL